MFRLSDDDGRAVDMLLDRATSSNNGNNHNGGGGLNAEPAIMRDRLESVESILSLLNEMPQDEPPANLVAKTLRAVEARRVKRRSKIAPAAGDQPHDRPLA